MTYIDLVMSQEEEEWLKDTLVDLVEVYEFTSMWHPERGPRVPNYHLARW